MAAPYTPQPQYMQAAQPAQPQPPAAAAGVAAPPLFALLIPGRTLATNFQVIDAKKMMIQVPAPTAITELTVCMLQPSIPPDHGVAVYYSLPPFAESTSHYTSLACLIQSISKTPLTSLWMVTPLLASFYVFLSLCVCVYQLAISW